MIRKLRTYTAGHSYAVIVGWLLITAAISITSFSAALYLSGSSDDLVYPYLFQHLHRHSILLPGQHSNILKFPLFLLQAHLPYTLLSFMIVTVGLTVVSLLLWVLLAVRVTPKTHRLFVILPLIPIVLNSGLLVYQLTGTTIRNIEYPVMLTFIIAGSYLLTIRHLSRRKLIFIAISAALYAVTCAGDSLFLYAIVPALLAALLVTFVKFRAADADIYPRRLLLMIAASALVGFGIPRILEKLGVFRLYTDPVFKPHILPASHLAASIRIATQQLINMTGANLFSAPLSMGSLLTLCNFILLTVGSVGLLLVIFNHRRPPKAASWSPAMAYLFQAAAFAYFSVFAIYIVSDLVVMKSANGVLVSAGQDRYISIMPLLLVFGIVYITLFIKNPGRLGRYAMAVIIATILLGIGKIPQNITYNHAMRSSEQAVAQTAQAEHVGLLVTGYWYGASTRFWSHNSLDYVTVAACNAPQPAFNNRADWYSRRNAVRSALVVVREGADQPYWDGCSDQQLRSIYGAPQKIIELPYVYNSPSLWIYNYDVRSQIGPFAKS